MSFNECFKPSVENAQGKTSFVFFFKTLLLIDNALVIQVLQWKKMCSYVLMSPVPLWVP